MNYFIFLKGVVSISRKSMFLWITVINGSEWGSHKYITVILGCCYEGNLSISSLKFLKILIPPLLVARVRVAKRPMLMIMISISTILYCYNFWNPLIERRRSKGVPIRRNRDSLWTDTERRRIKPIIKRRYSQYLLPCHRSNISTFPYSS